MSQRRMPLPPFRQVGLPRTTQQSRLSKIDAPGPCVLSLCLIPKQINTIVAALFHRATYSDLEFRTSNLLLRLERFEVRNSVMTSSIYIAFRYTPSFVRHFFDRARAVIMRAPDKWKS